MMMMYHFHVVDKTVSMLPVDPFTAVERPHVDDLAHRELVQTFGKQTHRIHDQSGF